MAGLKLIGCYPVAGEEPWHLVELLATDIETPLELDKFQLRDQPLDESNWQVAYDERRLNMEGTAEEVDSYTFSRSESMRRGTLRFCFFLYLNASVPLSTPFGPIDLMKTKLPERLAFVEFEEP